MTESEYRDELCNGIARASEIVNGLGNCKAFGYVKEDVKKHLDQMDKSWHLIPESEDWQYKMKELRLAKMASDYIYNLEQVYGTELERLQSELFKLDNKESVISKDYDSE